MSYTNQTQHYGLPQYVGTDVPAWLTDVNSAFAAIDQGMNAAKTQADSAATAAGQAANDIMSINSTLGTQAGQISAAASAAAAAQTTANDADGKADTNAGEISGLDRRVTALEQGGTGGSSLHLENVTATNTQIIDCPQVSGYIPIAIVVTNSPDRFASAFLIRGVEKTEISFCAYSSAGFTPTAGNYSATVLYVKTQ